MEEDTNSIYHWGTVISREETRISRTLNYLKALEKFPFARLVEIQKKGIEEALILDFQVELPQKPCISICRNELIAIVISPHEDESPIFLALRKGFPETLHQNLVQKGEPKSLCLFEEPYSEIRLRTTEIMFLQRVANWLSRAAIEELHMPDQPLEPLLLTNNRIIFDRELFNSIGSLNAFIVRRLLDNPLILKAFSEGQLKNEVKDNNEISYLLLPVDVPPWHSRTIEYTPINLEELCGLLNKLNLNLQNHLLNLIEQFQKDKNWHILLKRECIILLRLPKTRIENGPIENYEFWAFLVRSTIENLSIKLGILGKIEGQLGKLLGEPQAEKLESIPVIPLKPTFSLTKNYAKILSGLNNDINNITAIGLGALGSQIVLNLAKQGFGTWHLIDEDVLLPHNLSRHGLPFYYEGQNKSFALACEINNLLDDENIAKYYPIDVLKTPIEGQKANNPSEILSESEVILDFSTSRAVASFISKGNYKAHRICCFINSTGTHLVVISEGKSRKVTIDDLDKQLFARIIERPELADFNLGNVTMTSYAGSCRDTSVILPQDTLSIFAGIASKFIKDNSFSEEPCIRVWELSNQSLEIKLFTFPISPVAKFEISGWFIHIPTQLISVIKDNRTAHFPNETGGVLIGSINQQDRIIYIVSFISSPVDSIAWPTSYIRGVTGLKENIKKIEMLSGNELYYIGEWHSHPKGFSDEPSNDDLEAHQYLVEQMSVDGFPGLMMIIADENFPRFLVDIK